MKKTLLLIAVLASVTIASAQNSYRERGSKLSITAALNPNFGENSDWTNQGHSLFVNYGWMSNPHWYFGMSTGLYGYRTFAIPVMGEVRFYMLDSKNSPYMGVGIGKGIEIGNSEMSIDNGGLFFVPQIGFSFKHLTLSILWNDYLTSKVNADVVSLNIDKVLQIGIGWEF